MSAGHGAPSRPVLFPERNAKIIALRNEGVGPREIARRLGVTANVVAGVLHRAGLTDGGSCFAARRRGKGYTAAFREAVLAAAHHGTLAQAAVAWRVHPVTVWRWRKSQEAA